MAVAAESAQVGILDLLLASGVHPDRPDARGMTPLMRACEAGFVEIVRILLDWGADPDFSNVRGETPALLAIRNGHVEVVNLLIRRRGIPREAAFGGKKGEPCVQEGV